MNIDVHQHIWTEPLLGALAARRALPFVRRIDGLTVLHSLDEQPYVIDGVLVYVEDVESHFEKAKAAGATILSPLEGGRYRAEDLEGHRWMFMQSTGANPDAKRQR